VSLTPLPLGRETAGVPLPMTKNVGDTGGELVARSVLDVHNVEPSKMTLSDFQHSDTTQVVTTGDHDGGTDIKLEHLLNLSIGQIELDGIVNLDDGVRVTDGATLVCHDVRDALSSELLALNLAELELGLLGSDSVDSIATLCVEEKAEILVGLLNSDDILETSREVDIGSDLAVNLNGSLSGDLNNLTSGKSILESVSQENDEWQAFSELVRTC